MLGQVPDLVLTKQVAAADDLEEPELRDLRIELVEINQAFSRCQSNHSVFFVHGHT